MIIPEDLNGDFGADGCADGTARAFFGMFREGREKTSFIEVIAHCNDADGTCRLTV
jgi:hypothetical protein